MRVFVDVRRICMYVSSQSRILFRRDNQRIFAVLLFILPRLSPLASRLSPSRSSRRAEEANYILASSQYMYVYSVLRAPS